MIMKRITCKVKEQQKENFYEHQKQWKSLRTVKGFLGQIGGWSTKERLTACIYAFWESLDDYQTFMEDHHDQIFVNSGQENTYESINVCLYRQLFMIAGEVVDFVHTSQYIRVASAEVKEDRINHFVDMQKTVWNAGMQKTEGMLVGMFANSQKQKNEFLVLSGWESEAHHQNYVEQTLPELLKIAKPQHDVHVLTGEQFKVEEAWRVSPSIKQL
ncbi:YdbC family protein [Bacillus sp. CLL-7-23]|uniref:YdbC family protein n=1 Tax=Bacillus changyiensis TaxID=3004103 RepID=A0ABT4X239_9BACI|nr:YdbC family protein [Bacillus changyiensis]MDA7026368.1 YdbC family protein [Bacillus changyiensis]